MANNKKPPEDKELLAPMWVVTWGDLISLLLTFFILLFTFSAQDQDQFRRVRGTLGGGLGLMTPEGAKSNPNIVSTKVRADDDTALEGSTTPSERRDPESDDLVRKLQSSSFDVPMDFSKTPEGLRISIESDRLFSPFSLRIRDEAREIALEVARYFETLPVRLVVEAHTDDRSWRETNATDAIAYTRVMGLNIAEMIVNEAKWNASRIGVASFGASRPVTSNESPEGRRSNRRVALVVISDDGGGS